MEISGIFLILILVVLAFEFYPVVVLNPKGCKKAEKGSRTSQRSFVVHVHTFYSYDSLGKVEELNLAAQKLKIDAVFTTDHDNDLLKRYPNLPPSIKAGKEYQHPVYGRLLELPRGLKVLAHPNGKKREYLWRGKFERGFLYELINLKDILYSAPLPLKVYLSLRFLTLYPFRGLKALDYFPRLVPLGRWIKKYLDRTGGILKVVGGCDHHVKFTFWEKPKSFVSFPPYEWSFYILQNRTLGDVEPEEALSEGSFYISFCGFKILPSVSGIETETERVLFFNYRSDGSVDVNSCGEYNDETVLVAVYRYTFRVWRFYFGLTPAAVWKIERKWVSSSSRKSS